MSFIFILIIFRLHLVLEITKKKMLKKNDLFIFSCFMENIFKKINIIKTN